MQFSAIINITAIIGRIDTETELPLDKVKNIIKKHSKLKSNTGNCMKKFEKNSIIISIMKYINKKINIIDF